MTARIVIDPAECRRVARMLEATAEDHLGEAQRFGTAALPAMPADVAVSVSERICDLNTTFGRIAANLEEEARVLELAARIIELDQELRSANWGMGVINAALGAVLGRPRVESLPRLADDALHTLLTAAEISDFTIRDWQQIAFWKAGIDADEWNPEMGLQALDDIVRKVYAYYGELYLRDPRFKWAGMARVAGPMFYAGWQDMYVIRNAVDPSTRAAYLRELLGVADIPTFLLPPHIKNALDAVTALSAAELRVFEHRFLSMQKQIFEDLGWQHEAFTYGGLDALRKFEGTDDFSRRTMYAWEGIASGLPDRVTAGTKDLLYREQWQVIQDDYDIMRNHHPPIGWGFTYVVTAMAENPYPGGQAYRDFDGITIDPDPDIEIGSVSVPIVAPMVPRPDLEVRLPLGNISYFDQRWRWIEDDMYPSFVAFEQTEEMQRTVTGDFNEQTRGYRRIDVDPYAD